MDEQLLQHQVQAFIRQFGLFEHEHTPCNFPLSPSQAHALQVLGQRGTITQSQLAEQLHLEKSTVSRLVNHLVEQGWVERTINPESRREVLLTVTSQGRTVSQEVRAQSLAKYRTIWECIAPERRAQVLDALAFLTSLLKEENCS